MLGSFNNWNIIQLSHKSTSWEEIDKNNKVVIDGISYNVSALVQTGKYGAINTIDATTMLYSTLQ